MSIDLLTAFFGWCSVIGIGVLLVFLAFTAAISKDALPFRLAAQTFGIAMDEVRAAHFRMFMQLRLAVFALNVVPWIALKIIA